MASSRRSAPSASAFAVYSGVSKLTGDVALGCEIVDLGRLHLLHEPDEVGRICHVAVVHQEAHVALVGILDRDGRPVLY